MCCVLPNLMESCPLPQVFGFIFFAEQSNTGSLSFIRVLRMLQVIRFLKTMSTIMFMWVRGSVATSQLELYKRSFDL